MNMKENSLKKPRLYSNNTVNRRTIRMPMCSIRPRNKLKKQLKSLIR